MMSEWDKLSERKRVKTLLAMGFIPTWLEELLVEGNRLKKKAEKWDELDSVETQIERLAAYVDEDSGETMEVILGAVENRLCDADLLEQKLDEVSDVINTVYNYSRGCDGRKDGFTCPIKAYLEVEVLK